MAAGRARRCRSSAEQGFTLIELIVVMMIIGILAAIAVPLLLSQRAKARDAATQSDTARVGKEIASYYVEGGGALTLDTTTVAGSVTLNAGATVVTSLALSKGTALQTVSFKATNGSEANTWCVALSNPSGQQKDYFYSAASGLNRGSCP